VSAVTVPLLDIAIATPRSRLLAIDVREATFDYLPGQALLIGEHGQEERRPYSIASSPERSAETGRLELLIALEANGDFGPHLPAPRTGTLVDIVGPLGTFVFPTQLHQQHLLFVAGGTGISPLRSMVDHALRIHAPHQMAVLYSARRHDEFAFIDEFRGHAAAGRLELHQTVTRDEGDAWVGGRGRISRGHFESVLHDPVSTLCFVCGPRTMVAEAVATLKELGLPEEAIRTEGWAVPRI
jgi:NAD(P)H-flavin reductase